MSPALSASLAKLQPHWPFCSSNLPRRLPAQVFSHRLSCQSAPFLPPDLTLGTLLVVQRLRLRPPKAGALSWIPCLGTRAPVRMGSSQTNKHKNLTLSFISQTHHAITLIAFTTGDVTFVMFLGLKLCRVRTGTRAVLLTACSFPLCLEGPAMHWGLLPKT